MPHGATFPAPAAIAAAGYLGTALVADGVLFFPGAEGGNVFIGALPDTPDAAIVIVPTGGNPMDGAVGLPYDEPSLQVIVRGTAGDPTWALDVAAKAYNALQGYSGPMGPGDSSYVAIEALIVSSLQTGPAFIGNDANGRPRYSLNFDLHIRNTTTIRP